MIYTCFNNILHSLKISVFEIESPLLSDHLNAWVIFDPILKTQVN